MAINKLSPLSGTNLVAPTTKELHALFNDRVITPDDSGYDRARTVFYGGIDRRPAAIVRVADAWVTDFSAALRQCDRGVYVNFLGDEGQARLRAAYPGSTWDRLAAIKANYDPTNLFRHNHNILPA